MSILVYHFYLLSSLPNKTYGGGHVTKFIYF